MVDHDLAGSLTDPDDLVSLSEFAEVLADGDLGPSADTALQRRQVELRMLRRRHGDFPEPRSQSGRSQLFLLEELLGWYSSHKNLSKPLQPKASWLVWRAGESCRLQHGVDATRRFAMGTLLAYVLLSESRRPWKRLSPALSELLRPGDDVPARLGQLRTTIAQSELSHTEVAAALVGCVPAVSRPASRLARTLAASLLEGSTPESLAEESLSRLAPGATPTSSTTTADSLARLLVAAAHPTAGKRIFDPAAGEGGLLLAAARSADGPITVTGRELDEWAWRIAVARLLVHGVEADLGGGPTDFFADPNPALPGDIVVVDPPFASRRPDRGLYQRWLRACAGMVAPRGRLVIALPARTLGPGRLEWRSLAPRALRAVIIGPDRLRADVAEAVAVWIIEPDSGDDHLLIIDATRDAKRSGTQNTLPEPAVKGIRGLIGVSSSRDSSAGPRVRVASWDAVDRLDGDLRLETWFATDQAEEEVATSRALELATELRQLVASDLRSKSTGELDRALDRLIGRLAAD